MVFFNCLSIVFVCFNWFNERKKAIKKNGEINYNKRLNKKKAYARAVYE